MVVIAAVADLVKAAASSEGDAKERRASAVAAALEVVAIRAAADYSNFTLQQEFKNLSVYADQIQAALDNAE